MTKTETTKLLALMVAAWPRFEVDDIRLSLWHEMFADVDFAVAQLALKKLMLESPHPPSIADLRRQILAVTSPAGDQMEPAEAWALVARAVREHGYYRPREALEFLPERIRATVEAIGWQEICASEQPDVIRAQFMRMYEQIKRRSEEKALLPPSLREQIAVLSNLSIIQAKQAKTSVAISDSAV